MPLAIGMAVKYITSRDNPDYRDWLSLAGDKRARRDSRRTLLEGPHLAEAALDAGVSLLGWLLHATAWEEGRFAALLARQPDLPMLVVPDALFKALAPSTQPAGLLAMVSVPAPLPGLAPAGLILLLEDIRDPGNLGALVRTGAAAGVEAIYLSPGCAEAWSPKCLRGAQGAHFDVRLYEDCDLPALAGGLPVCHAAVLDAAASLFDLDLTGPVAFAFGNEGAGLSPALRRHCRSFTIPMPGRVESLNVAAAAAICLFEAVRQRQA